MQRKGKRTKWLKESFYNSMGAGVPISQETETPPTVDNT
jgi:hypothetical protein